MKFLVNFPRSVEHSDRAWREPATGATEQVCGDSCEQRPGRSCLELPGARGVRAVRRRPQAQRTRGAFVRMLQPATLETEAATLVSMAPAWACLHGAHAGAV